MTKNEYMAVLKKKLIGLPIDEFEAAITYYSEYFDEAGEEQALKELGDPNRTANMILAEFAAKKAKTDESPKTFSSLKLILLGIFAVPIGIPLAATIFGLLVGLAGVIFAMVVSFGAICLSLGIIGIANLTEGVRLTIAGGLFAGMVNIGVACLSFGLFIGSIPVIKKMFKWVTAFITGLFAKIFMRLRREA